METNLKLEKKILNLSFVGSAAFLLSEIIMAVITGSNAILMDCVFDIADLIMIGPFMVLVPLLYKPVTEKRPYGFSQVESLFVIIKYALLMGVDIILIIDSVHLVIDGGNEVNATAIAIFELAISAACVLMYVTLSRINKKYSSPSIKAELYIWKLDALSTMGVGVAFLIKLILDHTPLHVIGPYVDPGIAILLAVILLKEPVIMIIDSLKSLVLFAPEKDIVNKVKGICETHLKEYGYYINFLDIIKTGRKIWAEVYIVLDGDTISISNLKAAHKQIVEELSGEFDSIFVELIPDVEEAREENLLKMQAARRQDKINYVSERERKQLDKKAKKLEKKE